MKHEKLLAFALIALLCVSVFYGVGHELGGPSSGPEESENDVIDTSELDVGAPGDNKLRERLEELKGLLDELPEELPDELPEDLLEELRVLVDECLEELSSNRSDELSGDLAKELFALSVKIDNILGNLGIEMPELRGDIKENIRKLQKLRGLTLAIVYEIVEAIRCPVFRDFVRLEIRAVVESNLVKLGVELPEDIPEDIVGELEDALEELQDELDDKLPDDLPDKLLVELYQNLQDLLDKLPNELPEDLVEELKVLIEEILANLPDPEVI